MPTRIMQAVAMPRTFLFAPVAPATGSIAMHACLMFMMAGLFNLNPLYFIASAIISHVAIIAWGFKEPHLERVMQARGYGYRATRNLDNKVRQKGFRQKFTP